MTHSEISSDLVDSYKKAEYQVVIETDVATLHIDQYSTSISQLFTKTNQQCAALITAFNPLGQQRNHQDNRAQNTQLHKILTQYTDLIFESVNTDPTKQWPDEQSFLALGVSLETVKTLGTQFTQNAVVWIDIDAIPRLILLR